MNILCKLSVPFVLWGCFNVPLQAGCFSECCAGHRKEAAQAMVLAKVSALEVLKDGGDRRFVTVATLTIEEELVQRKIPAEVVVRIPGGTRDGVSHFDSRSVDLELGASYFMHLSEEKDSWSLYQCSADKIEGDNLVAQKALFLGEDVAAAEEGDSEEQTEGATAPNCVGVTIPSSRSTPTGYFETGGVPARLRRGDSGQPILVEVDTQVLPDGITQEEALQAVQEALDAWEVSSGLSFLISDNFNFGQSARLMDGGESVLHIQMHDLFNEISSTSTLGIGGGASSSASGGNVGGVGFRRALDRYVVMNHESVSNQNKVTLAEVLTHEIGHALGLRHSSNDSFESEPLLEEATMYFRAHADGRGATTNCYDQDRIQFGYPATLPPVTFIRRLRAVTRPSNAPNSPANSIKLLGFAATSAPLTFSFPEGLGTQWTYDAQEQILTYTPDGFFGDSVTLFGFFDRVIYQVNDGTNTSQGEVWVVALRQDDNGAEPDILNNDLPEAWLEDSFGGELLRSDPTALRFQPEGDFDNDGLSNLTEFQIDSDAADPASGPVTVNVSEDMTSFEFENVTEGSVLFFEQGDDLLQWNVLSALLGVEGTNRIFFTPPTGERAFFRGRYGN